MNFAEKLLNLRTEYGYSQETLPETDKIINLSNFFGVSTDYLLKDNIQLNSHDSLDRVVLKFLGSAKDMDNISEELVEIMRDGIIDDEEKIKMESIIETLDTISQIITEIKQKIYIQ